MGSLTFNIMIGPCNSHFGHICQVILWICSTVVTFLTRIAFLLLCVYHSNSILVRFNPPSRIVEHHNCSDISIVTGPLSYELYKPTEDEPKRYYLAHDSDRIGAELIDEADEATQYLTGHGNHWIIHSAEWSSYTYDDDGYRHSHGYDGYCQVYYYCGDITNLLNTIWLPFITWYIMIIFPQLLLSYMVFWWKFKNKSFKIIFLYPGFILFSIFSHHNIGPISWSQNTLDLIHSRLVSYFNILLTFLGMCFFIHLSTATFDGEGRVIDKIMVIVIFIPMFIISAILSVAFLHNCCRIQRRIFNPEDKKLYIIGTDGTVILEPEKIK